MAGSTNKSTELFARAEKLMPGGVSSPVRAFRHIGGAPVFMSKGEGAFVWDEDGNRYVDYCLAWGPLILGHAHPAVIQSVEKTARDGLAFGTCHRNEQALAELILSGYQWADRVRFVVSGTEAVQTAVRLARGYTGRKKLLKFTGCYHGHVDSLMAKAGSGLVTQGIAESEGVVSAGDTVVAPLADEAALELAFKEHQFAAVIVEPVPANNGMLLQTHAWLKKLRALTEQTGALLIFDEVICGFRFGYHGYGEICGVQPDLVTLGKIIGGGLPVGAITGKASILDRLAPLGAVYQAGTMAGNPVALAAGIATLTELKKGEVYKHLELLGQTLAAALPNHVQMARVGGTFWIYYDGAPPVTAEAITKAQADAYRQRYRGWLEQGIYLPPSAYEVGFLSAAHTEAQIKALGQAL